MTKRRPLALGAAAAIGFGSLFIASPAIAEEPIDPNVEQIETEEVSSDQNEVEATDNAPETAIEDESAVPNEAPVEEAKKLAKAGIEVVAIGVDDQNAPVIVQTEESNTDATALRAIESFGIEQGAEPTVITIASIPQAYADTDVVGGAGYMSYFEGNNVAQSACSIGFAAWSPSGDPVALTAGHCTRDGSFATTSLSLPSDQPAITGLAPNTGFETNGTGTLGWFGFSQFGGVGNSIIELDDEGDLPVDESGQVIVDPQATDIAVIEDLGEEFTLLPEVTDWETGNADDLAQSTVPVKSATLADPVTGSTLSKSGRTTGYTTGTVGVMVDGWSIIADPNEDPRWVRGFESNVLAAPGDSGGAVIQNGNALGVISGGTPATGTSPQFTWTASLKHALPHLAEGYEIALDIDEPAITSVSNGGNVQPGAAITGTAPSNALEVAVSTEPNSGSAVPVSGGEFSVTAPTEPGTYTFSLTAMNGKSSSQTVLHTIVVDELALAAPGINPVKTSSPDFTITGTGTPGAEINGDVVVPGGEGEISIQAAGVTFSAIVNESGVWSADLTGFEVGTYIASASQSLGESVSPWASIEFAVQPAAPVITSIAEGSSFAAAKAPSSVSGTGSEGATIVLAWGDQAVETTVVDGAWTVDFGAPLAAGDYALAATQNVNAVSSDATTVSFSVLADGTVPPANPGNGDLANTGGAPLMPLGIAAFAMLLVGGAVTIAMARRKKATEI